MLYCVGSLGLIPPVHVLLVSVLQIPVFSGSVAYRYYGNSRHAWVRVDPLREEQG